MTGILITIAVFIIVDVALFIFYRKHMLLQQTKAIDVNRLQDLKLQFEATKKMLYDRLRIYHTLPTKADRQKLQKKDDLVWIVDSYALMLKQWRKEAGVW